MNTFFALNRKHKIVEQVRFTCWEQVQGAFRCGIRLSNGVDADGIGRCVNRDGLIRRADYSGYTLIENL